MIRRKKFDDEDEQADRWLISYADFITLLFAFFVVMYATSTINLNKYRALSSAVVNAFQGKSTPQATPNTSSQNQTATIPQSANVNLLKPLPLSYIYQEKRMRDQEKLLAIGQSLANFLAPWQEQGTLNVMQHPRGIRIDIQNQLLFNANTAEVSTQGQRVLAHVVSAVKDESRWLQIEGHTVAHKLTGLSLNSNWETSSLMAAHVIQAMIKLGMPNQQLEAIGLADIKPISTNENAFADTINQRISIWILSTDYAPVTTQDYYADKVIMPNNMPNKDLVKPTPADTSKP